MTKASRREILRTAVWSVPLVAVTAAVPLAAASGGSVFASFQISGFEPKAQTVSLLVTNAASNPSGAPVTVEVIGPGASQLMDVLSADGWTVTALFGNRLIFERTDPLPASTSLLIQFRLLVDAEDDLLLIGDLRAGSLQYGFSLSR